VPRTRAVGRDGKRASVGGPSGQTVIRSGGEGVGAVRPVGGGQPDPTRVAVLLLVDARDADGNPLAVGRDPRIPHLPQSRYVIGLHACARPACARLACARISCHRRSTFLEDLGLGMASMVGPLVNVRGSHPFAGLFLSGGNWPAAAQRVARRQEGSIERAGRKTGRHVRSRVHQVVIAVS
jgi:hypothetical protein